VRFRGGTYAPVSSDGQRFLINTPPDLVDESPIIVVTNWMARFRN
jgi:hypothetical protein